MIKPTPNPPEPEDSTSPYASPDSTRLHEAAEKALDHYLKKPASAPSCNSVDRGMQMFMVAPDINPEAMAIQTYETFSSVSILLLDLADSLEDKPRHLAMAIYQLSEMAYCWRRRRWIRSGRSRWADSAERGCMDRPLREQARSHILSSFLQLERHSKWERACSRSLLLTNQAEAGSG